MKLRILLLLFFLSLLVTCAHQVPPSGGPDDVTAPEVVSVTPSKQSINVPLKQDLTLVFSEWIVESSAEKSISIFPPIENGFRVRVSGPKLHIIPRSSFAESTTYHVEISTALQDLHGNPIGTPFHLIFSTGENLDSATIHGCIVQRVSSPNQRTQPKVALFRLTKDISDSIYFQRPEYMVQTDSFGTFKFDHIAAATYRLIAFNDDNNDNRLQPATESAYAPLQQDIEVDNTPDTLLLFPSNSDTSLARIRSVHLQSDSIIVASMDKTIETSIPPIHYKFSVASLDTPSRSIDLSKTEMLLDKGRFALFLSQPLSAAPYYLVYGGNAVNDSGTTTVFRDTIRFNGVSVSDTTRPQLEKWWPRTTVNLSPRLYLQWSEPVILDTTSLFLHDTLGDTVTLGTAYGYSDTTLLTPNRSLLPGRTYTLAIPFTTGIDLAGNMLGGTEKDSAHYSVPFTTMAFDDLAVRLQGGASCLDENPKRKWLFSLLSDTISYIVNDSAGFFRYDSIPAGNGTVGFFIDNNDNNQPDIGNLVPWVSPEPYIPVKDTIEARARWEIEGIQLENACTPCKKVK